MKLLRVFRNLGLIGTAALLGSVCAPQEETPNGADRPDDARLHEGITYRAGSQLLDRDPSTVRTTATVINTSGEHREITFPDGCTVLIVAYADEERQTPVWEQERIAVCTLALQIVQLGPGDSVQYHMDAAVPEILGDSLQPGRYHLSGLLRPDQDRVLVPAGDLQLVD
jgi:hypothetical protein